MSRTRGKIVWEGRGDNGCTCLGACVFVELTLWLATWLVNRMRGSNTCHSYRLWYVHRYGIYVEDEILLYWWRELMRSLFMMRIVFRHWLRSLLSGVLSRMITILKRGKMSSHSSKLELGRVEFSGMTWTTRRVHLRHVHSKDFCEMSAWRTHLRWVWWKAWNKLESQHNKGA